MTSDDHDDEAIIRRALHAAAESVEPASDGLERIRHRLASPHRASWRARASGPWLRAASIARLRRAPLAAGLRPVLAIAGAVAIVVAAAFALGQIHQYVTPANSVSTSSTSQHPSGASSARSPAQVETGPWSVPLGVEPSPASRGRSAGVVPPVAPAPARNARTPQATEGTPSPTVSATPTPTPLPTDSATSATTAAPAYTGSTAPATTPFPSTTPGHARTGGWWPRGRLGAAAVRAARFWVRAAGSQAAGFRGHAPGPAHTARWPRCGQQPGGSPGVGAFPRAGQSRH
jgi:hypothetical protein